MRTSQGVIRKAPSKLEPDLLKPASTKKHPVDREQPPPNRLPRQAKDSSRFRVCDRVPATVSVPAFLDRPPDPMCNCRDDRRATDDRAIRTTAFHPRSIR